MTESFQPADPKYRENVDAIFSRAAFILELGIELRDFGAGWCETSLKMQSRHLQQDGFAHAGVVATMADHTAGASGASLVPEDSVVLTVEYKINLLRPAVGDTPDNWICDAEAIYPEYLSDLNVLKCPSSPFGTERTFHRVRNGAWIQDPRCVSSLFYIYTGYLLTSDEQALGLFEAAIGWPEEVVRGHDIDALVPVWTTSTPSKLYASSALPIMWDRVPLFDTEFAHLPEGINVLHFDGHVEFVKYSPYNNPTYFPATRVSAETFGSVLPTMPAGCG